jgi:hypothetical protein
LRLAYKSQPDYVRFGISSISVALVADWLEQANAGIKAYYFRLHGSPFGDLADGHHEIRMGSHLTASTLRAFVAASKRDGAT